MKKEEPAPIAPTKWKPVREKADMECNVERKKNVYGEGSCARANVNSKKIKVDKKSVCD